MEVTQLPRLLPDNQELAELVGAWRSRFSERWRANEIPIDEITFRRDADGRLTFDAQYFVDDDRVIKVSAERVSTVSVPGIRGQPNP